MDCCTRKRTLKDCGDADVSIVPCAAPGGQGRGRLIVPSTGGVVAGEELAALLHNVDQ